MLGVILAAGDGGRLRPYTDYTPKVLIPLKNKPLIWYPMSAMARAGISRIGVIVGHKAEQVVEVGNFRLVDLAALEGNGQEQGDAEQAYAQALLNGHTTWIFLPRDQWPESWTKFHNLVCHLRLALYEHPLSGAFWGKHCDERLRKVGFERIPEWESCYIHKGLRLVLLVVDDDFKLAGKRSV